jgi:Isoprenylcysteine carboxyl methyltransferase (ICMT) family
MGLLRNGWFRHIVLTGALITLSLAFFIAHAEAWVDTHRPVGLGAVGIDLVAVTLFAIRRQPLTASRSAVAWIVAIVGGYGLLLLRPDYEPVGELDDVYTTLQVVASVAGAASLLTLGRSFGIVAANRGVRTTGPYAFVRHPTYLAYFIIMAAYVLENPSYRNAVIVAIVGTAMIFRIREEETQLGKDPDYVSYRDRVRYRLLPFVF